jgi:hypothetical protein
MQDFIFQDMTRDDFVSVMDPKVKGTRNLYEVFRGDPLDFLIICGSMSALAGTATQSNYCSANAFQDAYAAHLRHQGAPVVSMNIGMVGEVGYIASNPTIEEALLRNGIHMMYEYEFHHLLEISIRVARQTDNPACLITGLEPERLRELWNKGYGVGSRWTRDRRVAVLTAAATRTTATGNTGGTDRLEIKGLTKALGPDGTQEHVLQSILEKMAQLLLIKTEDMDPRKAPVDYGIDSMVGAELRHWLFSTLKTDIGFRDLLSPETKIIQIAERSWECLKA